MAAQTVVWEIILPPLQYMRINKIFVCGVMAALKNAPEQVILIEIKHIKTLNQS